MSSCGAVMRKTTRCYQNEGLQISITPVERLTSVNSVYSLNNFCRVCNVNLLYNIWIWKIPLVRRCPFQKAKYSRKVVICAGISRQQGEHCFIRFVHECRGNWTNFESSSRGLVSLQRRLIRRSRSREK